MGETGVACAQGLHVGTPILVGVSEVGDQQPHQDMSQLALPFLSGVVEARVPRFGCQPAACGGKARLSDEGAHEQRELRSRLTRQLVDVLTAEATVASRGAKGANPASVGPFPEGGRMYVEPLR